MLWYKQCIRSSGWTVTYRCHSQPVIHQSTPHYVRNITIFAVNHLPANKSRTVERWSVFNVTATYRPDRGNMLVSDIAAYEVLLDHLTPADHASLRLVSRSWQVCSSLLLSSFFKDLLFKLRLYTSHPACCLHDVAQHAFVVCCKAEWSLAVLSLTRCCCS